MSRKPQVYRRPIYDEILERAHEPRQFIQVLVGPRQVGKTTVARQVMDAIGVPGHFASADAPDPEDIGWIYTQWAIGRQAARDGGRAGGLLVLDEVQKIRDWSDVVKQLWDEDTASGIPLRVMLLGSAPLLVRQGLSDSLAGRFEVVLDVPAGEHVEAGILRGEVFPLGRQVFMRIDDPELGDFVVELTGEGRESHRAVAPCRLNGTVGRPRRQVTAPRARR